MKDNKEVTKYILNNMDSSHILLEDNRNNKVIVRDSDFVNSFICRDNYIYSEVIRELPQKSGTQIAEAVNKLNSETFLEKYFISEEGGKRYFNMSIAYTLHENAEEEVKVLINYIRAQAKAAYAKLTS